MVRGNSKRRPRRFPTQPTPEPLDVDAARVVTVCTGLWALAGLVLAPFHRQLIAFGLPHWLGTCVAGVVLGIIGVFFLRHRRARIDRARAADVREESAGEKSPSKKSTVESGAAGQGNQRQLP